MVFVHFNFKLLFFVASLDLEKHVFAEFSATWILFGWCYEGSWKRCKYCATIARDDQTNNTIMAICRRGHKFWEEENLRNLD